MEQFILQLGTMSLQATVVLGVVFLFRMIFHKTGISKKYTCLLWLLPYLCMICPWKLEGDFGFWRQVEFQTAQSAESLEVWDSNMVGTVTEGVVSMPGVTTGQDASIVSGTNGQITMRTDGMSDVPEQNDMLSGQDGIGQKGQELTGSAWYRAIGLHSHRILWTTAYIVWIIGLLVLLIYSADAHLKLHTKLICCMKLCGNIYLADDIAVPFVMGIWKPRIYLPTGMAKDSLEYVIAHERTHIKRRDPLKKTVAFLITCIHWFNPLAWVAFHFFGKDMEMACDEETVLALGIEHRKEYATVLLQISSGHKMFLGAPLAFGEGSVKARIINIVAYKKTWRIVSVLAVLVVLVLAAVFMTRESAYTTMEKVEELMAVSTVEQDIYLTMNGQTAQLADEEYFREITDFLRSMEISRKEESLSRAEDRPADVTVRIGWDVYKFTSDCSSVWLDDGVKPSFSYKVKKPEQLKAFLENIIAEWQMAGGRNVAEVSFAGASYFTCTLPEGTWQNRSHSLEMNDIYSGFLINGNFEEPAHGDNVVEAWYSAGGMGVGIARTESVEGSPVMKYEDGALVSVGWFSNHSSITKVEALEGCTLPAVLYEGEHDLFTTSEADEYIKEHNMAPKDLDTMSEFWYVFMGQEDSEFVYTVFLNKDYFSKEDVMELARSVQFTEDSEKTVVDESEDSNVKTTEVLHESESPELLDQVVAERIYTTLRDNRDITQYITCTLPEGTWLGEYEPYVIDVYLGSKILGDFEKQGHYDCAADTWCSLCAPGGIGITPNVAQGGYDIMEFEDGKPISVHWYSNHSNFKKVGSYVDDFAMPALLYEGEVDLFTLATAEKYAQQHNLKVEDLKLTAKFWFVFFGEEESDLVYTVYLNQEYFSKEDMMELARSVQFVQQFSTKADEDSAEEAYSVTDHLAAHGVDCYENEFVKLDAVEGLSYVGEVNGIGIYNQDYYCGQLRIHYFMDIKFADTWQDDRQLELILDSMGLGKSGYVELLEHKTVDGVERYVYEGGVRPFDYADGEWLVGAGIFPSEEAAGEEARIEAVVLFGEADLGVGFCLFLNKTIVTEEKFWELVDAISFKEDAFTMINVAEIAFSGATTPSMAGTYVMQREFAKRLTYDIAVGELTYQVPEHTVALHTGANSWELYAYDSGSGDRWVGTVYAGTVSEVETVSEGCGIPMEEKPGVYYYETPLFSEEQQVVLSGRANTDMLKQAMKKYTQEILVSKGGEHMIRVVMVDLN